MATEWERLYRDAEADRDRLAAELQEWKDDADKVANEQCAPDEKHCWCVSALRKEINALKEKMANMKENVGRLAAKLSDRERIAAEREQLIYELGQQVRTMRAKLEKAKGALEDIAKDRSYKECSYVGCDVKIMESHEACLCDIAESALAELRGGEEGKK